METASAAPGGLARGLLWMGWRHGAGARESAPKTEREGEREERKEKQGRVKSEGRVRLRLLLLPVIRSALYRRALAPIHHLSVRHQSEAQSEMYTAVGAKGWRGEMEKSYCTRCGRRLQEFQIILEMNKKKSGSSDSWRRSCPWTEPRAKQWHRWCFTGFSEIPETFLWCIFIYIFIYFLWEFQDSNPLHSFYYYRLERLSLPWVNSLFGLFHQDPPLKCFSCGPLSCRKRILLTCGVFFD